MNRKIAHLESLDAIDIHTQKGMQLAVRGYTKAIWPQIAKRYARVLTDYPWIDSQVNQEISVFVWRGLQRYDPKRGAIRYAFVRKAVLFEVFRGVIRKELSGLNQTSKAAFSRGETTCAVRIDDPQNRVDLECEHPSPEDRAIEAQRHTNDMRQLSFAVSRLSPIQRRDLKLMWEGLTSVQSALLENKTEQAISNRRRNLVSLLRDMVKESVPWNYTDSDPLRILGRSPCPDMRNLTKRKGAPSKPLVAVGAETRRFSGFPDAKQAGFSKPAIYRSLKTGQPYNGYLWAYGNS